MIVSLKYNYRNQLVGTQRPRASPVPASCFLLQPTQPYIKLQLLIYPTFSTTKSPAHSLNTISLRLITEKPLETISGQFSNSLLIQVVFIKREVSTDKRPEKGDDNVILFQYRSSFR